MCDTCARLHQQYSGVIGPGNEIDVDVYAISRLERRASGGIYREWSRSTSVRVKISIITPLMSETHLPRDMHRHRFWDCTLTEPLVFETQLPVRHGVGEVGTVTKPPGSVINLGRLCDSALNAQAILPPHGPFRSNSRWVVGGHVPETLLEGACTAILVGSGGPAHGDLLACVARCADLGKLIVVYLGPVC